MFRGLILFLKLLCRKSISLDHNTGKDRVLLFVIFVILIFSLIIWRVIYLSQHGKYSSRHSNGKSYQKSKLSLFDRRDIVDRNGNVINSNIILSSLYMQPNEVIDVEDTISGLREIFPELKPHYLRRKIGKQATFNRVKLKSFVSSETAKQIIDRGLNGMHFEKVSKRIYLHDNLFSHVFGYTSSDLHGITGLELYADKDLSKKSHEPLVTSLDYRIQNIIRNELMGVYQKFNAFSAAGIVMDIENGEVLGVVSLPDFDPKDPQITFLDNAYSNKFSFEMYELGSIFKVLTFAQAFSQNIIEVDDKFNVKDAFSLGKYSISDYHYYKKFLNVAEILYYSSNKGTAQIADKLDRDLVVQFYKDIGLLNRSKIELVEKSMPLYSSKWSRVSLLSSSYGYGVSVSLVNFVQSLSTVFNSKFKVEATLIKGNRSYLKPGAVLSVEAREKLQAFVRLVVTEGSGRSANVPGYCVGGKTGTANKVKQGGYDQEAIVSSFVGVFPMYKPKYIVAVVVDEAQVRDGIRPSGGSVAAPVVGRVIKSIVPMLNVQLDETNQCKKLLESIGY